MLVHRWPRRIENVLERQEVAAVSVRRIRVFADEDDRLELRTARRDPFDERRELALGENRDEIGVLAEIAELVFDVAVVDVDGNGAQLECGDHCFHELGAVEQVNSDVRARTHPARPKHARQTIGSLVELPKAQSARPRDERRAVRNAVDQRLEQVRDVELHDSLRLAGARE